MKQMETASILMYKDEERFFWKVDIMIASV